MIYTTRHITSELCQNYSDLREKYSVFGKTKLLFHKIWQTHICSQILEQCTDNWFT